MSTYTNLDRPLSSSSVVPLEHWTRDDYPSSTTSLSILICLLASVYSETLVFLKDKFYFGADLSQRHLFIRA